MLVIAGLLAAAVLLIFFLTLDNRNKKEEEKMKAAAKQLIRGERLAQAINREKDTDPGELQRQMLLIQTFNPPKKYVFDPEEEILIGKSRKCQICIENLQVSSRHCRIVKKGPAVLLEDLCSENGTEVIRGFKKTSVNKGYRLKSGDRIRICDTDLKVRIFYVDATFL